MLKACNVTKQVAGGTKTILDDVSLTVEPGKLTALIGPSGSGKTTLFKALSLLDLPTSGTIELGDTAYTFPAAMGERGELLGPKPWPTVTAVFQQLFLWPHLTLRQNILLPLKNAADPSVQAHLETLIDQFDMAEFIDRYPNETSGGQKQRAAIARALILRPKYILLDEITSALDIEQAAKVLTSLEGLKKEGIGVLLITHHINFAARAADQIVFLDKGKVVETGGPKLISTPKEARTKEFFATIQAVS